ncbi:MAG: HPr family phosphocarrier protein [Anaerovibrio sp.]|nr:HPr family phosphocarrier protein [Anaerovibrio sp.]
MREEKFTITNSQGLHARPAGQIAKEARAFQAKVTLSVDATGKKTDAKSLMGIMTLQAKKGTVVTVSADGPDENEAVEKFGSMIESGFGED